MHNYYLSALGRTIHMVMSCVKRWLLASNVAMDDASADIRYLGVGSPVGAILSLSPFCRVYWDTIAISMQLIAMLYQQVQASCPRDINYLSSSIHGRS